jgi:hypothetical protein
MAEVDILTLSLFRFYAPVAENDAGDTAESTFRAERFIIMFRGAVNDNIKGVCDIYLHPWVPVVNGFLYFESCYAEFSKKCEKSGLNHRLLVGNGRNINFGITPSYGNRKTTEYTIVSDMFTHDRIMGVQYKGSAKKFNFGVSVHNGYDINARATGGPKSNKVPFLADRGLDLKNAFADNNSGKEIVDE